MRQRFSRELERSAELAGGGQTDVVAEGRRLAALALKKRRLLIGRELVAGRGGSTGIGEVFPVVAERDRRHAFRGAGISLSLHAALYHDRILARLLHLDGRFVEDGSRRIERD